MRRPSTDAFGLLGLYLGWVGFSIVVTAFLGAAIFLAWCFGAFAVVSVAAIAVQPVDASRSSPPITATTAQVDVDALPIPATQQPAPDFEGPLVEGLRPRLFTDRSGQHSVTAEFVRFEFQGSQVELRKEDGSLVRLSMNDLSQADQEWIRAEQIRRRNLRGPSRE